MTSIQWGLISVACITSGTLIGMRIGAALPKDHVSADSKDALKITSGMIATLVALVLGLLVASAKSSFDMVNAESIEAGSKTIYLDRLLKHYGPEAQPVRDQLHAAVTAGIDRMWPEEKNGMTGSQALEAGMRSREQLKQAIEDLTPATESQRRILAEVHQINSQLELSRWQAIEQQQNTLPTTFFIVLLCWLTMLFACIGLFAPRNITVCVALLFCAISFSTAIFLIVELSRPLDGIMKISSAPMRKVVEQIDK